MTRRSDALRNDDRVLAAAREVFLEQGADAPVSAIAARAGVGMGTLYRRYPAKEDLMRELLKRNIVQTGEEAQRGLADPDPWHGFTAFVHACLDAGLSGAPSPGKAFPVTDEILAASRAARAQVQRLVTRAQSAGVLRSDITAHDVVLLLTELRGRPELDGMRPATLRGRTLGIVLDGLRAPNATPLPGPKPTWATIRKLWDNYR
ncbi:MAG TPA: helix-turn-helix domain-containing protein [Amycolatopsis sp.]|jgi:AcrR family transcriptional regulator